jgi:acyl-CoA thioesterase-1
VVVIETGANDGLRGLNVDSTRANLTGIVQVVKQRLPQARVALVQMEAPPNLGPAYTKQFHDNFEQVARAEGVTLFPFLLDGVAGIGRFNQGDGIHPNPAGARIVAANVWRALAPLVDGWKQ